MTSAKTNYLESTIRDGYTSEDVRMWQALCRQCETEVGDSVKYMWTILDIAQHNSCGPIGIISMGRDVCDQKNVNQKFMEALLLAVHEPDDKDQDGFPLEKHPKVLDLTADDEDLSGSYEEEGEGPFDDDRDDTPNSKDAYEIDGFVTEDHDSEASAETITNKKCPHGMNLAERDEIGCEPCGEEQFRRMDKLKNAAPATPVRGLARSNALVKSSLKKRVLESISEEE